MSGGTCRFFHVRFLVHSPTQLTELEAPDVFESPNHHLQKGDKTVLL